MWILFLILITGPTQYEVHPLQTYQDATPQKTCISERERLTQEFKKQYPSLSEQDTYSFVCLKQKDKTA